MNIYRYTQEEITFLRENASGRSDKELTRIFNEHFNSFRSVSAIRNAKNYYKIRNGLTNSHGGLFRAGHVPHNKGKSLLNSKHERYIAKNIKGRTYSELADIFNEHFGLSLDRSTLRIAAKRLGLSNGLASSCHPVGTEVERQGYIVVKVAEPNKWLFKHIMIWEAANGSVPEGYHVVFGDGNKRNFDLNNLTLISHRQLASMHRRRLLGATVEQTQLGMAVADIYLKIADLKRKSSQSSHRTS